jgi:membrane protease YdiL (CAAX protease family)
MLTLLRRFPVAGFCTAALLFEWGAFAIVVGRRWSRGETMQPADAFLLFPLLVLSMAALGIIGSVLLLRPDIEPLSRRAGRWRVPLRWYLPIVLPPLAIYLVLQGLAAWMSPSFAPGLFAWGILIGLFPGICEELGWMGYLFPRIRADHGAFTSALILGVLWALWHLPVLNYLGAAGPHGASFMAFAGAFAGVLVAFRVIMVWVYEHTRSVLLMQLLHASSTGSLVLLSPPHISSADEALWYAVYAAALAVIALLLFRPARARR